MNSKVPVFAITTFLERIIPLALLPLILGSVGTSDYGKLYFLITIVNFAQPLLGLGFNFFFAKEYVLKNNESLQKIFSNFLMVQLMNYVLVIIILSIISLKTPSLALTDMIVIISLAFFQVLNQTIKEIFRIRQDIKQFVIIVLFIFLIDISITITLLKIFDFGYKSRIYASLIALGITNVSAIIYLRRNIHFKFNKYYLLKWYAFSKKIIWYKFSGVVLNKGDRFVIQLILGELSLGTYIIANQIASPFLILMNAINSGWNSFIYNYLKVHKFHYPILRKYFINTFAFLAFTLILYQIILPFLIPYTLSTVNLSDIFYLQLLICFAFISQTMYSLHLPIFISRGRQAFISKVVIFSSISNIILNVILLSITENLIYSSIIFFLNWMVNYQLSFSINNQRSYGKN